MNKNKTSSHKSGRDARTGEFFPLLEAQPLPTMTVIETTKGTTPRSLNVKLGIHKYKFGHDSLTEEYITVKEAQRRPSTTVVNTIICDPQNSLTFLQNAGILTPTGRLSSKYKK